jgi:hypothetical protein
MGPEEILANAGNPANYFPDLAKITGSMITAILLSNLLKGRGIEKNPNGWITIKLDEIENETGLSPIELQDARNQLKAKLFIEEKQVTATSVDCRVNAEKITVKMGTLTAVNKEPATQKAVIADLPEDSIALSFDMIQDVVGDTPFSAVNNNTLECFVASYGLKKVISTLDILAANYKSKPEPVNNPTLVLTRSLVKNVNPPENYVSYFERLKTRMATATSSKREAEKRKAVESKKPAGDDTKLPDIGFMP